MRKWHYWQLRQLRHFSSLSPCFWSFRHFSALFVKPKGPGTHLGYPRFNRKWQKKEKVTESVVNVSPGHPGTASLSNLHVLKVSLMSKKWRNSETGKKCHYCCSGQLPRPGAGLLVSKCQKVTLNTVRNGQKLSLLHFFNRVQLGIFDRKSINDRKWHLWQNQPEGQ